jgi:hypothetical protein
VASAAARICTPHFAGKASTTPPGTLASSSPVPNMPTTRGMRSCRQDSSEHHENRRKPQLNSCIIVGGMLHGAQQAES